MSHHRGSSGHHLPGGHHHPLPRSQSEYHHSSASSLTPASSSASSSARSSRVWENQQVLALLVSPSFYRSCKRSPSFLLWKLLWCLNVNCRTHVDTLNFVFSVFTMDYEILSGKDIKLVNLFFSVIVHRNL